MTTVEKRAKIQLADLVEERERNPTSRFSEKRNLCPRTFSISSSAYFDGHAGYMREIDKSSYSDKASFDFLDYVPA